MDTDNIAHKKRKGIKIKRLNYKYDPESFALDDLLRAVEKHFEEKIRRKSKHE